MSTSAPRAAARFTGGSRPAPSSALNVLLTCDVHGGIWTHALELARALCAPGHRVCLAVMGGRLDPHRAREAAGIPGLMLEVGPFALEWMDSPWADVDRAGEWLLGLERRERPDVVHLNGYAHAALPFRAPVIVGAHSCVCSWWRAVHGTAAPAAWDAYRARVRAGLDGTDWLVAPTLAMLRALAREHGPLPPSRVIHNGIAPGPFASVLDPEPLVVACGRWWDEAKNLRVLADLDLPWRLERIGPVEHPDGSNPPSGRVAATGSLPRAQVAQRMARASILVHPPLYEPFGLVPLEAALAGCALVLADLPSLRELWHGAAVFVDPRDRADVRTAILSLIRDRPRRDRLVRAGRARAHALNASGMADGYLRTYAEASRARSGAA